MIALLLLLQDLPNVPDGWRVELLARVKNPAAVAAGPEGRVYVAEDPMDMEGPVDARLGRVLCVQPDGRVTVFADKLGPVFGLAWHAERLYVHDCLRLAAYRDEGGVGRDPVGILPATHPNPSGGNNYNTHIPAGFRLAPDGYFYMAVGDKGIPGIPRPDGSVFRLRGGGVIRFRPDGSALEVVATGTRNIIDVAIAPSGAIFAFDNDDNALWGARMLHVVPGADFGYPWDRGRPGVRPAIHEARGIPAGCVAFGDDVLLCDWGRSKVTRIRFERDRDTYRLADREDLFTRRGEEFRPVGIDVQGDRVYVTDWNTAARRVKQDVGRLFRFTAPRPPTADLRPAPRPTAAPRPAPLYFDPPWDGSWWGTRAALNPRPLASVEHAGTSAIRERLRREAVDSDPAARRRAIEDLAPDRPSKEFLLSRLDAEKDPTARRAILAVLVRQGAPEVPALAARFVEAFDADLFQDACRLLRDPAVAARALAAAPTPAHAARLLALAPAQARSQLRHADAVVRAAAVDAVADRDAIPDLLELGAEALPALVRMPDARAERLFRSALDGPSAELRLAARRALAALGLSAGAPPAPPPADVRGGDPARGRVLFLGGLGCSRCHAVGADGGDIGPELTMVGAVYDRRTLAEHILFPDRIIHGAYRSTVLRLGSGDVLSGVLRGETALEIRLQGVDGRVLAVRKADVEARRVAETSIMPAGLVDGLPAADFADLLSYLESLKGEE